MATKASAGDIESLVWRRVVRLEGNLSPQDARSILSLRFSDQDRDRMHELSAKARAGTLRSDEQDELDAYERLGCVLDILHSKARRAIEKGKANS